MLLAVDMGNTQTVYAVFDRKKAPAKPGQVSPPLLTWRAGTAPKTRDEHLLLIHQMLQIHAKGTDILISDAVLSSVVPHHTAPLAEALEQLCGTPPLIVDHRNAGVHVALQQPEQVGSDRLVNARAAYDLCQGAAIVVDFGTATTFDVIDAEGSYQGGVIAPGIGLSIRALQRAAAQLPEIDFAVPEHIIGKNTHQAMQSGLYYGYSSMIEGIAGRITALYDAPVSVMATGGMASLFAPHTPIIHRVEPALTLHGLRLIFDTQES